MNFLKNLMIIAVLAAVGYGVYVSLARNNADPGQPPGVAEGWPAVPKVEMPSAKPSVAPGGPLALSGNSARPAVAANSVAGGTAPPLVPTLPASLTGPSPQPATGPTSTAPLCLLLRQPPVLRPILVRARRPRWVRQYRRTVP